MSSPIYYIPKYTYNSYKQRLSTLMSIHIQKSRSSFMLIRLTTTNGSHAHLLMTNNFSACLVIPTVSGSCAHLTLNVSNLGARISCQPTVNSPKRTYQHIILSNNQTINKQTTKLAYLPNQHTILHLYPSKQWIYTITHSIIRKRT